MELVRYNPNNPASGSVIVQFWGMLPNGSDNLLFGYTVVCTDACSKELPVPGGANYTNPFPGTRGQEGLATKVTLKAQSFSNAYLPVSATVRVTKTSRTYYNLGGVSFGDATEISFGWKVLGSLHYTEPGQFFRIDNPGLATLRFRGVVSCPTGYYYSALTLSMHRADGTNLPFTKSVTCVGPSGPSPSASFDWTYTPAAGVPAMMYIKLRASNYQITDLQMTVEGDPTKTVLLRGALGDGELSPLPGEYMPLVSYVPLGGVVRFAAVSGAGTPLAATFSAEPTTIEPGVAADALFPNHVLFAFGDHAASEMSMLAVHRGVATVTLTPTDAGIKPRTFRVVVQDPAELGTTHAEVNAYVDTVAHAFGVAPQFVKAHISMESGFDPLAYRYEPIGYIGDLRTISRGKRKYRRLNDAYIPYRLATETDNDWEALAVGANTNAADLDARNGLKVGCDAAGNNGVPLTSVDDDPVWASELLRCNDARQRWRVLAGKAGRARYRSVMDDPFSAQTSLAASYGYLQVMYIDAIDSLMWAGTSDGKKNPSSLFDTSANISAGGGSLKLGTWKLASKFKWSNENAAVAPDAKFDDMTAYHSAFVDAWQNYNPKALGYGSDVGGRVSQYEPVPARSLF